MAQEKWGSDGPVIARGKASPLCLLDRPVDTGVIVAGLTYDLGAHLGRNTR